MPLFNVFAFAFVFLLTFTGARSFFFQTRRLPPRNTLSDRGLPRFNDVSAMKPTRIARTRRRIPKYMLKLYEELTTHEGLLKRGMPYNVNAIRGIYSKRISKLSSTSMEIFYDIGYLRDRFAARRDEIHLYMSFLPYMDKDIFKPYVLRIHDIHTNQLIRQYKVPAFNYGWQVLSLSGWTKRWVANPQSNKGMRLTVYRGRGRRSKPALKNPFVEFPDGKDPYLILFGDDSTDNLSTWRFLSGFPLNSVAGSSTTSRLHRERRMTSLTRRLPQCKATEKSVSIKGKKIDDQHIIVQPESYKMVQCSRTCVSLPVSSSSAKSSGDSAEPVKKFCCVPSVLRSMGFLVTEPLRNSVTFTTIPNMVTDGCKWSLSEQEG